MFTESEILLRQKANTLTVPLEAVVRNGDDATVFAVDSQNILEERHVKLGLEDNARIEVLSGFSEGDRVVIGNRSQFRSGQRVRPKVVSAQENSGAGGS